MRECGQKQLLQVLEDMKRSSIVVHNVLQVIAMTYSLTCVAQKINDQ